MEYKECQTCPGYCCYYTDTLGTPLLESDITRMAAHLQLSRDYFILTYVTPLKGTVIRYRDAPDAVGKIKGTKTTNSRSSVCPFLHISACLIHNVKPKYCGDMRPLHIGKGITCREWHRVRAGVVEK